MDIERHAHLGKGPGGPWGVVEFFLMRFQIVIPPATTAAAAAAAAD